MPRPYEGHHLTEEQKRIVEDNMYYLWYYYKKNVSQRFFHLDETQKDDLMESLHWAICLAAENWDPERGKFTTACEWYFKSAITNYFRERKLFYGRYTLIPFIHDDSIDDESSRNDDINYLIVKKGGVEDPSDKKRQQIGWGDISYLFNEIDMTPQESEIIMYLYQYKFSSIEIAKMMGISRERIRQLKDGVVEKLKDYMKLAGLTLEDFISV